MKPSWRRCVPQLESYRSKIKLQDDGMSPHPDLRLRPYDTTNMSDVKVVFMGWNPYRNRKQATGFAFEANEGIHKPQELATLHLMLIDDIKCRPPYRHSLRQWTEQGVLLINRNIQRYKSSRGFFDHTESHTIQHRTLTHLDQSRRVFVFFGYSAQKLSVCITRGLVIKLPYPHPHRLEELKKAKLFSTINKHLVKHNIKPIDWKLT